MFAFMKNDSTLARKIVDRIPADKLKENLDVQDADGNTALMFFVQHCGEFIPREYQDIYFLLDDFINEGANVNLKNKNGQTALDIAIQYKKPKFEEKLRSVSAPPQAQAADGSSKSYKSKRKMKKMDGNKKRSGNKRSANKKKSKKTK
jgi:ankyrin repeat protein